MNTANESRRAELRARYNAYESARKALPNPNCIPAELAATLPPFSNDERAELETLDFRAGTPRPEFVYPAGPVDRAPKWAFAPGFDSMKLTGFMGNALMSVVQLGAEYRSCFGDTRRSVRATGINGAHYCGTIYGTYARMRPAKTGPYSA